MKPVQFKNTQIPLHYQIADYLVELLRKGKLDPEQKLPPEEELALIFSVSRTTVRKALDHLLSGGLIQRKQGSGTLWTEKAASIKHEKLSGINRQIFNVEKTRVKNAFRSPEAGNSEVNLFFNDPDDKIYTVFRRLRTLNNDPMSYTINYLHTETGKKINTSHLKSMTMLETLEKIAGIKLGTVEHEVEITRADIETSKHLRIPVLDPVLTVKTSVFDSQSNPLGIVWTHFVESKYRFKVVFENKTVSKK